MTIKRRSTAEFVCFKINEELFLSLISVLELLLFLWIMLNIVCCVFLKKLTKNNCTYSWVDSDVLIHLMYGDQARVTSKHIHPLKHRSFLFVRKHAISFL